MLNAHLNTRGQQDINNEVFSAFLSDDMTYSCPIWLPKSHEGSAEDTLEAAQERKLQKIIANARITSTDHVLEIGTGWGSFAIAAVRTTGCRVTTATISREQKGLAEARIAAAGFSERIKVVLCDYRNLPRREGESGFYDKVVSIEMLEAVGKEYLYTYFAWVDKLLKSEGGIAVFQSITIPETREEQYSKGDDFIRKHIFPGGHLPTVSHLVEAVNKGSKGTLIVEGIESIGGHYAKALRLWNKEFQQNFESRIRPALMKQRREGGGSEDVQMLKRKWEVSFSPVSCSISRLPLPCEVRVHDWY